MDRCTVQDITAITLDICAVQHRCHNIHQFYLLLFRGMWLPGKSGDISIMTGGAIFRTWEARVRGQAGGGVQFFFAFVFRQEGSPLIQSLGDYDQLGTQFLFFLYLELNF